MQWTLKRKVVAVAIVLLCLPLVYLFGVLTLMTVPSWLEESRSETAFNSQAWKSKSADLNPQWPTRIRMIDDFLANNDLRRMDRADVVGLLGEPDKTEYFREWDMVYWLGPERSWMSIDSEWLVIDLDRQGHVSKFSIVRD